jgi:hypothetical protein
MESNGNHGMSKSEAREPGVDRTREAMFMYEGQRFNLSRLVTVIRVDIRVFLQARIHCNILLQLHYLKLRLL